MSYTIVGLKVAEVAVNRRETSRHGLTLSAGDDINVNLNGTDADIRKLIERITRALEAED